MSDKPDFASELFKIYDKETKELFGEQEAKKLREQVNQKLKNKGLEPLKWEG